MSKLSVVDRFWAKVRPESGDACWLWTAGKLRSGFGSFRVHRTLAVVAHRYSYELAFGPVPDGKFVGHTCSNSLCVRPDHLKVQDKTFEGWDTREVFLSRIEKMPSGCWHYDMRGTGRRTIVSTENGGMIAHRYSYELHVGPIPAGLWVLHSCDNGVCVNPEHLRIGTPKDNSQDMVQRKRNRVGSRHPNAKLSESQVREIRAKYARGLGSVLGVEYGVSNAVICGIANGKTWRHVQ